MEQIQTLQVSNSTAMTEIDKESIISTLEHQIIMHFQTMKQVREKTKNQITRNKILLQMQNLIDEAVVKIKMLKPDYKLTITEDNVEAEIHSSYKADQVHIEDKAAIESKYSGIDKAYESKENFENAKQRFLSDLKKLSAEKEETEQGRESTKDNVVSEHHSVTEDIFNRIQQKSDINSMADEIRNDSSLTSSNIRQEINVEYDLVQLPSNGECYSHKKSRLSVSYLTAFDENMITSPNLYEDDRITEYLLKNKILDKDVNVMDLTKGDADAILVWLRKTGYGNNYPVTVTDKETGKPFDATINLDDIKMKEFHLKADENGLFDFKCEKGGALIKFRFLTLADMRALDTALRIESEDVRKNYIASIISRAKVLIDNDKQLKDSERQVLMDSFEVVDAWTEKKSKDNYTFANSITDTLERMVVSVNGNTDRAFIKSFVQKMPALDSLKFRKFVFENEPGMDFTVDIERPSDLGGGRIKTFLNWDKYVFTNTSNL